jgi:hypothetical protein
MKVASVPGVKISGLIFDAGPVNSPVLLEVGTPNAHNSDPADPTLLSDVFFRIGGATAGKATVSLVVNSDNVIIDDIWAWRADHGNGVGWTSNTADTGVIVNGDNVTAYGLFPFAAPLKKYSCPYLEVTHELAGGSFGNKTQREAAFSAIEAYAQGGFDVPPGASPITQLHPSEMVLPANLAENVRNMTAAVAATLRSRKTFTRSIAAASLTLRTKIIWESRRP